MATKDLVEIMLDALKSALENDEVAEGFNESNMGPELRIKIEQAIARAEKFISNLNEHTKKML